MSATKFNKSKRDKLACLFDALGHSRRILVLDTLLNAPKTGLSFGQLAYITKIDPSVLTHHLRMMRRADLIFSKTKGRSTLIGLHPKERARLQVLLQA